MELETAAPALRKFIGEMRSIRREFVQPADIVLEGAPFMHELLHSASDFLDDEHTRPSAEHYARNLIYADPEGTLSLYSLVWSPGQWTPVHDHGTWGLVAVVSGALHERNYIRTDTMERDNNGVVLRRGGMSVLSPGSVTSFVPNPDHIHRAGVPREWARTITLHLYGRNMNTYNVYDIELGRRIPVDVAADNEG